MADDVTLPGTGVVVASDSIGDVHHQRVKPVVGADGVAVDLSDAAPMPITPGNGARDAVSGALITITSPHHKLHEGDAFLTDFADSSMGDTDILTICFKTPAGTKRCHMVSDFHCLVGGVLEIWEGVTWTDDTGTLTPIINRKRLASMNSSGMLENKSDTPNWTASDQVLVNPSGVATIPATKISHVHAWGKKDQLLAGGARDRAEFVLKPDTQYAMLFMADGNSNKAQVFLNWYEHTDSE